MNDTQTFLLMANTLVELNKTNQRFHVLARRVREVNLTKSERAQMVADLRAMRDGLRACQRRGAVEPSRAPTGQT